MLTHSLALIITYPCEVRDYSGKEKPRSCRLFPTTFSQISCGGRTRVCFSFSCCNRKSRRHSGVLVIPVKLGGSQFFGRLCSVELVILFSQLRSVVAYKASSPFFLSGHSFVVPVSTVSHVVHAPHYLSLDVDRCASVGTKY